jgi:outer membrane protein TolC
MLTPVGPAPRLLGDWDEALGLLRSHSTDLRTAEAGVTRAEGRWRQALSTLLPNARMSAGTGVDILHPDRPVLSSGQPVGVVAGGAGEAGYAPTVPLISGSASLTQSLVDIGAWRGVASASSAEVAASAQLEDVRRRLTLSLARGLVSVVAAERAAELNRVGLRQALERAALAQRTFELGAGTRLDVVRVRQDVEDARASLVAGDEQLRRAREALGAALGDGGPIGVSPGFGLDGLVARTQATCEPLSDTGSRADLAAARAQVDAARQSRQQAAAGYLPSLGLSSSTFAFSTNPGPARIPTWSIGAVLTVPIWEGGLREGLLRERGGVEAQAAEALERARRDVGVEVAQSRRGVEVAEALVKTAAEARALAEETDRLTRRSFEVGRGTSLELVQSGAALRRAELALALREFELVQARLDAFLTEARCDW